MYKEVVPYFTGKNNCDEYPVKLKSKPKFNILNSLNDYANTVTSSDFYTKKTNTMRQALKTVPVYVIVNGNNELVLVTTRSGSSIAALKRTRTPSLAALLWLVT